MIRAIKEAEKVLMEGKDIPIGCVIVYDKQVIASTHNLRQTNNDVTAHAEILAIREAQKKLGTSRLLNCEMFVTLEPCPMCAWAIIQSGIKTLYFGSYNTQYGGMGSVLNLPEVAHSRVKIFGGIEEEKCDKILEEFWEKVRGANESI